MDFGIVATSAGGNTDVGQPDIYPLPSYYFLKNQYSAVAAAAALMPAAVNVSNGPTAPLACPPLTDQASAPYLDKLHWLTMPSDQQPLIFVTP